MEIFEFKKNLPIRLREFLAVLSWSDKLIPASQVRTEWSYFMQLQLEPLGWQALWKIPKAVCEDLKVKFPTIVFGIVEHVIFTDLKAVFIVQAVENNDIHIPEQQEVYLEDLYLTKVQENDTINIERTAECIDSLRFFYKHIWMPWDCDNDSDLDWVKIHLESRLQLYYDLQKKTIKRSVANHIRNLVHEARYLHHRRQYLEMDLSDSDELEESMCKTNVTDLMKMHLRLTIIKNEMELLENPHMRKVYEDINVKEILNEQHMSFLVIKPCKLETHNKLIKKAREFINDTVLVQVTPTLQEALRNCKTNDTIILTTGNHTINFLENLNDDGSIYGLTSELYNSSDIIISSIDEESILFVFDGNFTLSNLILDCRDVRTGIVCKSGIIKLKNCHIKGDLNSSTTQGILMFGESSLILEDSLIEDFSVGIKLSNNSSATLVNTTIQKCLSSVEINNKAKINFDNVNIRYSKISGILFETKNLTSYNKRLTYESFSEIKPGNMPWNGNCTFAENLYNIIVINCQSKSYKEIVETNSSNEYLEYANQNNNDYSVNTTERSQNSIISLDRSN